MIIGWYEYTVIAHDLNVRVGVTITAAQRLEERERAGEIRITKREKLPAWGDRKNI